MKMIIKKQKYGWRVQLGDKWDSGLGSDEALICAANFLLNGDAFRYLKTTQSQKEWRRSFKKASASRGSNGK